MLRADPDFQRFYLHIYLYSQVRMSLPMGALWKFQNLKPRSMQETQPSYHATSLHAGSTKVFGNPPPLYIYQKLSKPKNTYPQPRKKCEYMCSSRLIEGKHPKTKKRQNWYPTQRSLTPLHVYHPPTHLSEYLIISPQSQFHIQEITTAIQTYDMCKRVHSHSSYFVSPQSHHVAYQTFLKSLAILYHKLIT